METYGTNKNLRNVDNRDAPLQPLAWDYSIFKVRDSVSTGIPNLLCSFVLVAYEPYHLQIPRQNPRT